MKRRNFIKGFMSVPAIAALGSVGISELLAKESPKKPKGKNAMSFKKALEIVTNKKGAKDSDKVKLTVPEIAENGAVVPVKVSIDLPIEEVKSIHILTTKNSNARAVDVFLTPKNGKAYFATRIKLGGTQEVVAIAALKNGNFIKAQKKVKVTIGGCG